MHTSYHIIIADDDDGIRALLARVIVRLYQNVSISAVSDGVDALMVFGQRGADLIITNYDMPLMNGIDLITALRSRHVSLPIIMVSADDEVEAAALAAGVTHFLVKPFSLNQISQVLTSLLVP